MERFLLEVALSLEKSFTSESIVASMLLLLQPGCPLESLENIPENPLLNKHVGTAAYVIKGGQQLKSMTPELPGIRSLRGRVL